MAHLRDPESHSPSPLAAASLRAAAHGLCSGRRRPHRHQFLLSGTAWNIFLRLYSFNNEIFTPRYAYIPSWSGPRRCAAETELPFSGQSLEQL